MKRTNLGERTQPVLIQTRPDEASYWQADDLVVLLFVHHHIAKHSERICTRNFRIPLSRLLPKMVPFIWKNL